MFALVGMNAFGGCTVQGNPYVTFDNLPQSIVLLFQVLTGDSWESLLFTAQGMTCGGAWAAIPYFVSWYVYSNFVIINLFITAILDNFDAANKEFDKQKQKQLAIKQNESIKYINLKLGKTLARYREDYEQDDVLFDQSEAAEEARNKKRASEMVWRWHSRMVTLILTSES